MKKLECLIIFVFGLWTAEINASAWTDTDKYQVPIIESVDNSLGLTFVSLSNGSRFQLRPVMYYIVGVDYPSDNNEYFLFRRDHLTVEDIFRLPRTKSICNLTDQVYNIDFIKGQPCQILLPQSSYDRYQPHWSSTIFYRSFSEVYNKREGTTQWAWSGPHETIPLNFFDTAAVKEPLRGNLYEHPHDKKFYIDYWPNSTDFAFTSNAHLLEADLLKFHDTLEVIDFSYCKFCDSQIHARVKDESSDNDVLQNWQVGDHISAVYSGSGVYVIENLSQNGSQMEVYLSDPGYSDLRNFGFTPSTIS